MIDLRTAAQQALEALTSRDGDSWTRRFARDRAIEALEAALAEPVQEPVAWMTVRLNVPIQTTARKDVADEWLKWGEVLPLYTSPPQRKPLAEPAERMHTDLDIPWRLGGWLVPKAERERRLQQVLQDFPKLRERDGRLAGQRKPLTDAEIVEIAVANQGLSDFEFARAIERAHGIT